MNTESKKSVVRSIRIPKELDDLIREDAKDAGVTVNALISSALNRYAEWDRYAERFGFVSVSQYAFRALIEAIEEEKLMDIAENFAPSASREVALHWYKQVNFEAFFRFLLAVFRYGRLGEHHIETSAEEDTLTLHHELGPKWSRLLSRSLQTSFESIAKVSPRLSLEENTFTLSFPPGTLNGRRAAEG
ncbi:MAG: hypothetical protein ACE5I4_03205 [Thermoplasmata archaeon]